MLSRVPPTMASKRSQFRSFLRHRVVVSVTPAIEMHLHFLLLMIYFNDLAEAPIVYLVFCVDILGHAQVVYWRLAIDPNLSSGFNYTIQ